MDAVTFEVVDELSQLQEAVSRIRARPYFALDLESFDLGRHYPISVLQISLSETEVIVLDAIRLGATMFESGQGVRELLEDPSIAKIMHDCRRDSAALYFLHGVHLRNVFDTQVFSPLKFELSCSLTSFSFRSRTFGSAAQGVCAGCPNWRNHCRFPFGTTELSCGCNGKTIAPFGILGRSRPTFCAARQATSSSSKGSFTSWSHSFKA